MGSVGGRVSSGQTHTPPEGMTVFRSTPGVLVEDGNCLTIRKKKGWKGAGGRGVCARCHA